MFSSPTEPLLNSNQQRVMRSLFVEDILGARPTKHVYNKSAIRHKHQEEVFRFGLNPEKRVIDWYSPSKKITEPLERNDDKLWNTKKTLQSSLHIYQKVLPKLLPLQRLIKDEGLSENSPRMHKSSILSGIAEKSLNMSADFSDPYFPHKYANPKLGESNKWSGARSTSFVDQPSGSLRVPSTKGAYLGKW